jgi:hypothetical protein
MTGINITRKLEEFPRAAESYIMDRAGTLSTATAKKRRQRAGQKED